MPRTTEAVAERLYRRARADRWQLPLTLFAEALEMSAQKAFSGRASSSKELERYLETLNLDDLALACACAAGHESAWEHFVREHRPVLYRSADAIDPAGGARELADSLYAELYGVSERGGQRPSLFRYFHGRSSLATWLRAVLAQRYVDRMRAGRRLESLPDEDAAALVSATAPSDPDRRRYAGLLEEALGLALSRLDPRDRLRLGCYYAQEMTLAQIGRTIGEHEATVSRHLARTRRAIRDDMEQHLRDKEGLSGVQIVECFESVIADAGTIDLKAMLARTPEPNRSK